MITNLTLEEESNDMVNFIKGDLVTVETHIKPTNLSLGRFVYIKGTVTKQTSKKRVSVNVNGTVKSFSVNNVELANNQTR